MEPHKATGMSQPTWASSCCHVIFCWTLHVSWSFCTDSSTGKKAFSGTDALSQVKLLSQPTNLVE